MFLKRPLIIIAIFIYLSLLIITVAPTASADVIEISGTITVYAQTSETMELTVPGVYDDTYKIHYTWSITDFNNDETYFHITDGDGGMFANHYSKDYASGSPAHSGGETYTLTWRNENEEGSFTVEYSAGYELIDYSSQDDDYYDEDDTIDTSYGCCCSAAIVALVPAAVLGAAGIAYLKRNRNSGP